MHSKENSTPYDVCISQPQLSRMGLLYSHQAGSEGAYNKGLQADYQAGFRLGSDKLFKCQQALQRTPYCYNSHVVNTGIPPSLATSLYSFTEWTVDDDRLQIVQRFTGSLL
jgi:hypothetical protein